MTFSIFMMMFCLGGLVGGILNGKKGYRFTLSCCALCLFIGFSAASRINSLMGIYLSYGVFCGFGVGLGYNTAISLTVRWFPDKQRLVSGVTLMGFGFGGMLRRRNFWLCFVWAIILSAAGLTIINESTTYAEGFVNGDLTRAAALAGIVSIANGVGRVLSGQLFDMNGYRIAMLSVSVLYLAATGVLTLSLKTGSVPVLAAAFLLTGLRYGGVPPLNSAFTARFFGREHYAVNFSIVNMNASYLGPACGGGSYVGTFLAIAVFAIAGAVITLLIRRPEEH